MEAIRQLRQEHALMARMLDLLGESLDPFEPSSVSRAVTFFVNYDDLYHHAKEETVLFPELLSRAGDIMAGSIQVMRKEHTLARAYLTKAQEIYPAAVTMHEPHAMQLLVRCLKSFVALEREHLKKEDIAIYGPAENLLPPSMDDHLLIRFAELTSNTIEAQSKALYEEFGLHADVEVYSRAFAVAGASASAGADRRNTRIVEALLPSRSPLAEVVSPRDLAPPHPPSRASATVASARKNRTLFQSEAEAHRALLLHDFGHPSAVQANQYLIIDEGEGLLLDPGGPKVYPALFAETSFELQDGALRYISFSHQDPDVCTSMNAWLMDTRADAYVPGVWERFLSHFGVDELLEHRLKPVPDEGMWLELGGSEIALLPAHFLHSCGNIQVYDPTAKILFTGDLGASMGAEASTVTDFRRHLPFMEPFHRRFMASNEALRRWVDMVRTLDLELIAPQHGPIFEGKVVIDEFLNWCESLECGVDLMADMYVVPPRPDEVQHKHPVRRRSTGTRVTRVENVEKRGPRSGESLH